MYTKNEIFEQLRAMKAPRDSVVLFHSSLRLIGEVEGGGEGLLDALIEYFTAEGGLFCVPAHTWGNLGRDVPTLDLTSPWSNLGAFPMIAAADGRGVRTENPTHSMVIFGDRDRAMALCECETTIDSPTSPNGICGKMISRGGYVLLAGVSQNKNTLLHAVDEILKTPNRMTNEKLKFTVKRKDGQIVEREMYFFDEDFAGDVSLRFPKYETAFRYYGAIKDGFIGDAPAELCDARVLFETVKLIWERGGKDPLIDEEPIPPSLYYKKRA